MGKLSKLSDRRLSVYTSRSVDISFVKFAEKFSNLLGLVCLALSKILAQAYALRTCL